MGAFYLIRRNASAQPDATSARLRASFRRQGFGEPTKFLADDCEIGVYGRLVVPESTICTDGNGNVAACAGTLFYGSAGGQPALRALLADLARDAVDWGGLWGSFALVIVARGAVTIATDRTGTFHLHVDSTQSVYSTSFLALAESLPALTIDRDAVYDYVFQGAPHGGISLFQEIALFEATTILEISPETRTRRWPELFSPELEYDLEVCAAHCVDILKRRFAVVAKTFGDRIETALSGGYDSRLMLALLWNAGVRPKLHVYGRSSDADVRVALQIAETEKVEIEHVDKGLLPLVGPDEYEAVVAANCDAFDGFSNDGIFDSGADRISRQKRYGSSVLALNGGGGEIFRNFFHVPDAPLSARRLLLGFYARFDFEVFGGGGDPLEYLAGLESRMMRVLGASGTRLTRRQVQEAYPSFRCRFWMGRNNSLNNRLAFALTPFIDAGIVEAAMRVPLSLKNAGRLEARMIALVNPRLAAYPSAYSIRFDRPPSLLYRAKDLAGRLRPPLMRRLTYLMRHRSPKSWTGPLRGDYIDSVLGGRFEYLEHFFRVSRVRDWGQYNRICTLEYLFRRLAPGLR